ncbi:MAG: hypothetical protein QM619_02690 [Micropruina sp.]|uniref:hypothetical protein n=1 Tax=Micropruina sp. TaxID=2737536 RepID=UPI0039E3EC6F
MSVGPRDLDQLIQEQNERRQRDPQGFLADVLEAVWLESDESQVDALWRHHRASTPWWTENALRAFEAVLADPPAELCAWIEAHAGRGVDDDGRMYGGVTCHDWLALQFERVKSLPM